MSNIITKAARYILSGVVPLWGENTRGIYTEHDYNGHDVGEYGRQVGLQRDYDALFTSDGRPLFGQDVHPYNVLGIDSQELVQNEARILTYSNEDIHYQTDEDIEFDIAQYYPDGSPFQPY